jgi:hypothetical protein
MSRPADAAFFAASKAIARASLAISQFVRELRESRSEFDILSTELHSLGGVLDLLRYDAPFFSVALAGEPWPYRRPAVDLERVQAGAWPGRGPGWRVSLASALSV